MSRHRVRLLIVAVAAYPFIVHFSVITRQPLALWYLAAFAVAEAVSAAAARRWRSALLSAVFCSGLVMAGVWLPPLSILLCLPVLVFVGLLYGFGRSLLPDRTPLVVLFAQTLHGQLDDARHRYCRRVTWLWVMVFAVMLAESVSLALFAPPWLWSLFTNFLNYVVIAAVFLIEFRLRKRYFSDVGPARFADFASELLATDWRRLGR